MIMLSMLPTLANTTNEPKVESVGSIPSCVPINTSGQYCIDLVIDKIVLRDRALLSVDPGFGHPVHC